jgi:hypothetical protein
MTFAGNRPWPLLVSVAPAIDSVERSMQDLDGHLWPTKIAMGVNGSDGLILGFLLPGDSITTYWLPLDDARSLLAELPRAIAEAEKVRDQL